MSSLLQRLRSERRSISTLDDMVNYFQYSGLQYSFPQTMQGDQIRAAETFAQLVSQAYGSNGVISAIEDVRLSLFSEARLVFRQRRNGRPGDLFGTPQLRLFEQPWDGGSMSDLLKLLLVHADFGGNAFATVVDNRVQLLRPDWVEIILASNRAPNDPDLAYDAEKVGFAYYPGGRRDGPAETFTVDQVAHFMWKPDPLFWWRGLSWLTPVIKEIQADEGATNHKRKFFENAATPNLALRMDKEIGLEAFKEFKADFQAEHRGAANAYKTLFLGGGADPVPIGNSFEQMQFTQTQGAGETRLAAAAGVPPIIVGLSEGLQAATYSNYGQARRRFADGTLRPLWRSVVGALSTLIDIPMGAELWYDDSDIPFLQEDQMDAAEIQSRRAQTVRTLIEAGYTPESVVPAVGSDDFSLMQHTGLFSVQLQPPNSKQSQEGAA